MGQPETSYPSCLHQQFDTWERQCVFQDTVVIFPHINQSDLKSFKGQTLLRSISLYDLGVIPALPGIEIERFRKHHSEHKLSLLKITPKSLLWPGALPALVPVCYSDLTFPTGPMAWSVLVTGLSQCCFWTYQLISLCLEHSLPGLCGPISHLIQVTSNVIYSERPSLITEIKQQLLSFSISCFIFLKALNPDILFTHTYHVFNLSFC